MVVMIVCQILLNGRLLGDCEQLYALDSTLQLDSLVISLTYFLFQSIYSFYLSCLLKESVFLNMSNNVLNFLRVIHSYYAWHLSWQAQGCRMRRSRSNLTLSWLNSASMVFFTD